VSLFTSDFSWKILFLMSSIGISSSTGNVLSGQVGCPKTGPKCSFPGSKVLTDMIHEFKRTITVLSDALMNPLVWFFKEVSSLRMAPMKTASRHSADSSKLVMSLELAIKILDCRRNDGQSAANNNSRLMANCSS
jgi:hypothetical protein